MQTLLLVNIWEMSMVQEGGRAGGTFWIFFCEQRPPPPGFQAPQKTLRHAHVVKEPLAVLALQEVAPLPGVLDQAGQYPAAACPCLYVFVFLGAMRPQ